MNVETVYPDRDDLPEVPPFDAHYVCSVEWAWGGGTDGLDRRDEYWISRSGDEWLLWISGEDEDGDACHIVYAATTAPHPSPAAAAAHLLAMGWRTEGHDRYAFATGCGLFDADALRRLADSVWGTAPT